MTVKYLVMVLGDQKSYDEMSGRAEGGPVWTEGDMKAMFDHMSALNNDLAESGELVDAQGLTAPSEAKLVRAKDGVPVVSDGPYGEAKEVMAGYWIVDCANIDRAIEIAARAYDCPLPEGAERTPLIVHPIQEAGGAEM